MYRHDTPKDAVPLRKALGKISAILPRPSRVCVTVTHTNPSATFYPHGCSQYGSDFHLLSTTMNHSKLLVAALLIVLIQSCRTSTEPPAIAPGFRAAINDTGWTADQAYARVEDTATNCMAIYGFTTAGGAMNQAIWLSCAKSVSAGDTVSGGGLYTIGPATRYDSYPFLPGNLVIVSRTATNIQGRFSFTSASGHKGSGPKVTITKGEFNLDITN